MPIPRVKEYSESGSEVVRCQLEKDKLIRALWCKLNKLYSIVGVDNLTKEDLNLWTKITAHSAIQKQLDR